MRCSGSVLTGLSDRRNDVAFSVSNHLRSLEKALDVDLVDGRRVRSLVYVVARDHVQYCGGLPLEEQAQIISRAAGGMGPNPEYLFNTAAHLAEIGLHDPDLEWLSQRVKSLTS